mmetsp:Transcript_23006/g.48941  ORF Transcript_23006/g.48941 Transcript_23006/m.48941 type:complete len:202 (+) Transcript_23006:440-1045(+)
MICPKRMESKLESRWPRPGRPETCRCQLETKSIDRRDRRRRRRASLHCLLLATASRGLPHHRWLRWPRSQRGNSCPALLIAKSRRRKRRRRMLLMRMMLILWTTMRTTMMTMTMPSSSQMLPEMRLLGRRWTRMWGFDLPAQIGWRGKDHIVTSCTALCPRRHCLRRQACSKTLWEAVRLPRPHRPSRRRDRGPKQEVTRT